MVSGVFGREGGMLSPDRRKVRAVVRPWILAFQIFL